jgi:hypothetical protein
MLMDEKKRSKHLVDEYWTRVPTQRWRTSFWLSDIFARCKYKMRGKQTLVLQSKLKSNDHVTG